MIGLIITGHGGFASGMDSSLDIIVGKREKFLCIDFDGNGTDKLKEDLNQRKKRKHMSVNLLLRLARILRWDFQPLLISI